MSTKPIDDYFGDAEVIPFKEIPLDYRIQEENSRIYKAAMKLRRIGPNNAVRLLLGNVSALKAQKKAHVHYRASPFRLRTRSKEGWLYMWLENRTAAGFDRVPVPIKNRKVSAER